MIFNEQEERCHDSQGKGCIIGKKTEIKVDSVKIDFSPPCNIKLCTKYFIAIFLIISKSISNTLAVRCEAVERRTLP